MLEFGKVVNIRGRVMPSTLENIDLCAELVDGTTVMANPAFHQDQAPIRKVYLAPEHPEAYPPALDAILNADLIILGPGSLYTSVIPNLLVSGVVDAIKWSRGTTVYACNVATQKGETDHFTATDHIKAVVEYLGRGNLDYAVVNSNRASAEAIRPELGVQAVLDDGQIAIYDGVSIVGADVISDIESVATRSGQALACVGRADPRPGSVAPLPVDRIESRTWRSPQNLEFAPAGSLPRATSGSILWETTGSEAWHYGWQSMGWDASRAQLVRVVNEGGFSDLFEIAAIHDKAGPESIVRALKNDSVYGPFPGELALEGETLKIGEQEIALSSNDEGKNATWSKTDIPLVIVDGIAHVRRGRLDQHLKKGAKRVILPAASPVADSISASGSTRAVTIRKTTTSSLPPAGARGDRHGLSPPRRYCEGALRNSGQSRARGWSPAAARFSSSTRRVDRFWPAARAIAPFTNNLLASSATV